MKTRMRLPVVVAAALLAMMVATESANAVVRVYSVSFGAKAAIRPKGTPTGNSFARSGYLIFDTNNPNQSQTVEIFRNKTFQVNGAFLVNIFPAAINLQPADLNADTITDREIALIGFQSGVNTSSRVLIGSVPRNGFRIGNTTFFQTAKTIGGYGAVTVPGTDHFFVRERWTINSFSASNPVNTNAGVTLATAYLLGRGYIQIP
jgi:hypothetical protein